MQGFGAWDLQVACAQASVPGRVNASRNAYNKRHRHLKDCLLHLHHCSKRDYQGAIALLLFKRHANRNDVRTSEFLAYAHFHYGEHDKVRGTLRDKGFRQAT